MMVLRLFLLLLAIKLASQNNFNALFFLLIALFIFDCVVSLIVEKTKNEIY